MRNEGINYRINLSKDGIEVRMHEQTGESWYLFHIDIRCSNSRLSFTTEYNLSGCCTVSPTDADVDVFIVCFHAVSE
jgi:hypothetical protein